MEFIVHWLIILVMAIGTLVCLCAGLVVTTGIAWWSVEFVCRRFGWTRQIIEAHRRIQMEKRTEREAK